MVIRSGKHIGFIFLTSLLLLARSTYADASNWQVEIELSKTTYLEHEPIWLDVILTNISSDTLRCWGLFPPCQGPFSIEVIDDKGQILPYSGIRYDGVWGDGFIIESTEQYYECYDLIDLFGSDKISNRFGRLPAGDYSVRGIYRGTISNELRFEVVEPTGQERQVKQLLSAARQLDRRDHASARESYQNLIDRNPNSVYNESTSFRSLSYSEFLKRFPNSGHAEYSLRDTTRQLSYEEKHNYLQSVMIDYPETRAAKFAEQMLKLMEK